MRTLQILSIVHSILLVVLIVLQLSSPPCEKSETQAGGQEKSQETSDFSQLQELPEDVSYDDRKYRWFQLGEDVFALVGTMVSEGSEFRVPSAAQFLFAGRSEPENIYEGDHLPTRISIQLKKVFYDRVVLGLDGEEKVVRVSQHSVSSKDGAILLPAEKKTNLGKNLGKVEKKENTISRLPADPRFAPEAETPEEELENIHEEVVPEQDWSQFLEVFRASMRDEVFFLDALDSQDFYSYGAEIKAFSKTQAELPLLAYYGLEEGDVITSLFGRDVESRADVDELLRDPLELEEVELEYMRGEEFKVLRIRKHNQE